MSNDNDSGWVWLFWVGVTAVIIFWQDILDSSWRYSVLNDISRESVMIEKKPKDCEFWTAPMGNKNCHYDKAVQTVQWATSTTGKPIISYNDGKNWEVFTPPPPRNKPPPTAHTFAIMVSWTRVTE